MLDSRSRSGRAKWKTLIRRKEREVNWGIWVVVVVVLSLGRGGRVMVCV